MTYSLRAFTLVELIVVITIVGILSTVGFVSYSGYLTGARDSNRISQMVKLSDSLQVYATTKSLPLPDNYVEVTATGVILQYQGYAGTDVLETIDYTNGGKDPKDDTFYTYNVSKDRKLFQFTSFLEEFSQTAFIPNTQAIDYSEREIMSYGKPLGIYTDENNIPIQEIPSITNDGFLDIFSTTDAYTVHFGEGESLSGDSTVLRGAIGGGGLVGYWNFESLDGGSFQDLSVNNTSGTASGGLIVSSDGVIGNSVEFNGVDGEYVVPQILGVGSNGDSPHTISAWIYPTSIPYCDGSNSCREWVLLLGDTNTSHHWLIGGEKIAQFGIFSGEQKNPKLDISWNHITAVYDGSDYILYKNGNLVKQSSINTNNTLDISNPKLYLGFAPANSNYNGKMDELRIYSRDLDFSEVQNIYNSEKKTLDL